MTDNKYPRVQYRQSHPHGLCVCCSQPTADRASIEVSDNRLSDRSVFACRRHTDTEILAAMTDMVAL